MNEEELRAFLDSATVGDDEQNEETEEIEAAAESAAVPSTAPENGAPGEPRALSFDELIGRGMERARSGEEVPLVLPGPPSAGPAKPVTPPIVSSSASAAPAALSAPTAPQQPSTAPARPAPSAAAPTEPMPAMPVSPEPAAEAPTAPQPVAAARGARAATPLLPVAPSGEALPPTQQIASLIAGEDYEKISVTGGESDRRRLIPWLIVAVGVVIALLAAFFIVNALTAGGDSGGQQTTAPGGGGQSTESTPSSASPGTSGTTSTRPTTPGTEVPRVEVGDTMNLQVEGWGIQVDLSQKLGLSARYEIPDGVNLRLSSTLIDSYAAVCPGGQWGMTRISADEFEVLKPNERCAAAPELYDELWGLMDAMVQTARPI